MTATCSSTGTWLTGKNGNETHKRIIMNILIVSGGSLDLDFASAYLLNKSFDHIIAADAGLAGCRDLGLMPTEILGDFDSLQDTGLVETYRDKGVPVRTFPARKDNTDTDLALQYAKELGATDITVLGATGTRLDHTLGNIGFMVLLADAGIPCRIVDAHNELEVLSGPVSRRYRKSATFPYFSLLALSEEAAGIDLVGFSYPLSKASLYIFTGQGISNELAEEEGTIRLEKGKLLVIRSRD